jgi:hypothetical protein
LSVNPLRNGRKLRVVGHCPTHKARKTQTSSSTPRVTLPR